MLPYIAFLVPAGFPALAFDARHHGLSDPDGFASMKKFSEDIRAAATFLQERGFQPPFPLLGLSIGGSAALHAAAKDPRLGSVVTVGAFAHPRDAMIALGFGRFFLAPLLPLLFRFMEWRVGTRFDELAPEAQIAHLATPCLLIHGERDTVVPVSHAHRLLRASQGRAKLWLLPQRGHSDVHLEPGFAQEVLRFFQSSLAGGRPRSNHPSAA
jgi:pimeloyl-ACP methyl ester carboxylesterase